MSASNPSPKEIKWERIDDGRIVPITLNDVIEAVDASQSLILKEIHSNRVIGESPQMKRLYERHRSVLSVVRSKFAALLLKQTNPDYRIPSKRNPK